LPGPPGAAPLPGVRFHAVTARSRAPTAGDAARLGMSGNCSSGGDASGVSRFLRCSIQRDEKDPAFPVVCVVLGRSKVSDEDSKDLMTLNNLRELHLVGTMVPEGGLKELAPLKGLQSLGLGGTEVTDAGLKELGALKGLQWLNLAGTKVTDTGLKELSAFKNLQWLGLACT
jgi:hypothetical protein